MAPEQARGKTTDKRADIFAFGVVLHEMITGKRLFGGEDAGRDARQSDSRRARSERCARPASSGCCAECLQKDPRKRLRDIGDARFLLEESAREVIPSSQREGLEDRRGRAGSRVDDRGYFPVGIDGPRGSRADAPQRGYGENAALSPIRGDTMALSPDGSRIVFVTGRQFVKSQLAVRRLNQPKAMVLAGTEGAEAPFFSADGKSVGFFADGRLKRIDAAGGTPVTLCDAPTERGGSWGDDDQIVFRRITTGVCREYLRAEEPRSRLPG